MNNCPNCNTEFHCGTNDTEPCWCSKLPNIVPVDATSCLCPTCLKEKLNEFRSANYKYEDNLQSEHLITRFLTKADESVWIHFLADKESTQFFPKAVMTPEEHSVFWIDKQIGRYNENRYGLQALLDKNTGEFIGQCGLLLQEVDGITELEVGYHILKKHRGKGYAIEAAKLFKDYGFKNKQADSIISIIHRDNLRSQNVAIKNGMKKEKETTWNGLNVFIFRT